MKVIIIHPELYTIKEFLSPIYLPVIDVLIIDIAGNTLLRSHRTLFNCNDTDFSLYLSELYTTFGEISICLVYSTLSNEMKTICLKNNWEIL